jgi:hypothetical protein
MDQKLQDAIAAIQAKTGFYASGLRNKPQHTPRATRVTQPRSQKGRKYNAKAEAKRAEWRRSKGFSTRKEQVEGLFIASPDAVAAVSTMPDAQVESEAYKPTSSTAGLGHTGTWDTLPRSTLPVTQLVEVILTLNEAKAKGYTVQIGAGMYKGCNRYKVSDGAPWIVCRIEGEPARAIPSVRPDISQLYARHLTNPAQTELQQLQLKFEGKETRIAPYGEGSRDTAQVLIEGTWVSYEWCKANGKL